MKSNLSKTFKYINANGDELIFEPDYGFLINKPIGIDTLTVNIELEQGINQTGGTEQSSNVQPRPVNISGRLVGGFQEENKTRLVSTVRPDIPGRLYADDLYLDVKPTYTPAISPDPNFADFQFSLLAAYPYWRRDDGKVETASAVEPRFKFPFNASKPYRFGEIIRKQFIQVDNRGQVPVPYAVTFVAIGAVKNPKLTDAKTGKFLQINKTLSPGERLTVRITSKRAYVESSKDGECRGALDLASTMFRLNTGINTLKPEAASGIASMGVEIAFSTEYVGVVV